jgi:DDE domain
MVVRIAGERMYLWRAADHEGEVLDMLVQRRRNCRAAPRLMRKLLKKQGFAPKLLVTDKLRSYSSHRLMRVFGPIVAPERLFMRAGQPWTPERRGACGSALQRSIIPKGMSACLFASKMKSSN